MLFRSVFGARPWCCIDMAWLFAAGGLRLPMASSTD